MVKCKRESKVRDMTKKQIMDKLAEKNNGYLLTADVVSSGISKTYLSEYVTKYEFERVAQGVYMSDDTWYDEMYVIGLKNKEAIFSHESALYLHRLMEREPRCAMVTVSSTYNATHLRKRGCNVYTTNSELLTLGRTKAETNYGNQVAVYDMDRTICDIIRYKEKMDIQVFQTAIKEYMKSNKKNLTNLMKYANAFGIEKIVRMYVEVML